MEHPEQVFRPTYYHVLDIPGALVHQEFDLNLHPSLNDDVVEWCYEQIGINGWHYTFNPAGSPMFAVRFTRLADLVHFKMRWM